MLFKSAWLIAWNTALLALVVVVPAVAIYRAGWLAIGFMGVLAFAVWLWRHPAFLMGMWASGRS